MPRPLIVILAGLVIAAILGWMSAIGDNANDREIRDPWPDRLMPADEMSINEALSRLNASALFPKPKNGSGQNGQELDANGRPINGARNAGTPDFPTIRGVSLLDGQPHVTLEMADGNIETLAEGAVLKSGWQLKSVDPIRVIAAYEDEEITRPIRDYAPGHEQAN